MNLFTACDILMPSLTHAFPSESGSVVDTCGREKHGTEIRGPEKKSEKQTDPRQLLELAPWATNGKRICKKKIHYRRTGLKNQNRVLRMTFLHCPPRSPKHQVHEAPGAAQH